MKPLDVLGKFKNVRGCAGKWVALCPAHQDKHPSLAISEADDRLLLHCFSGCETKDVMTAVGLDISDLFYQKRTSSRLTGASPRCYTEVLQRERILVAVINSAEKNERPLTTKEQNRRRLGQLRINKIEGVLHE